jgi:hypothetical protein
VIDLWCRAKTDTTADMVPILLSGRTFDRRCRGRLIASSAACPKRPELLKRFRARADVPGRGPSRQTGHHRARLRGVLHTTAWAPRYRCLAAHEHPYMVEGYTEFSAGLVMTFSVRTSGIYLVGRFAHPNRRTSLLSPTAVHDRLNLASPRPDRDGVDLLALRGPYTTFVAVLSFFRDEYDGRLRPNLSRTRMDSLEVDVCW